MQATFTTLGEIGIIPVVALDQVEDAAKLAHALSEGGLPCAEITFRTPAAAAAIRRMCAAVPDMLVGAGTVLTIEQAAAAVEAGARFIVSPGFDATVVDWCQANAVPITPGVATPTEVIMGYNKGLRLLKFFPAAASGGVAALKAIGAPFGEVRFIPTGGISAATLVDYISLPMVHACGGSWMVDRSLIAAGDFARVTELAREATAIVAQVRGA